LREAMAVTGYIASSEVPNIRKASYVDVRPERDVSDVVARVKGSDVEDVRQGSTEGGLTLVQLVLRTGASVETVQRTTVDVAGMRAFHDPVLNRVRQEATAKQIMV